MKIYNTKPDEYGYPTDFYPFLRNTRLMESGTKGEARLVMEIYNLIAKVVNYIFRTHD